MDLLRQTKDRPAFPDLLWARPENKAQAGKLLVVGGNAQAARAPAEGYAAALAAGAGAVTVLLPDALRKSVGRVLDSGEYAASTPSGSLATLALPELLQLSQWADGVLWAGDIGRNSETAVLLEKYLDKFIGTVTLTRDVIEYVTAQPALVQNRPSTLLVLSYSQLQKLAIGMRFPMAFTFEITLERLINSLRALTGQYPFMIMTRHLGQTFASAGGRVSSTPASSAAGGEETAAPWRLNAAAGAAVWLIQNPTKPFEAITTSLICNTVS